MPELPEVETVRRLIDLLAKGNKITEVEAPDDTILFSRQPALAIREALLGNTVSSTGRRGKLFWLSLEDGPTLMGHLGMTGWVREIGASSIRLVEQGKAPLDDESGRPRFLKVRLKFATGRELVLTDPRRMAAMWLTEEASQDPSYKKLGPDAWTELPPAEALSQKLSKRKAPIKALLMDQTILAGIGNWVADEVLFHARIAPARPASSLNTEEWGMLRSSIWSVLDFAVGVGADAEKYPEDWLFNHRWGGSRGKDQWQGHTIRRDQVGGRTTAWVPDLQV